MSRESVCRATQSIYTYVCDYATVWNVFAITDFVLTGKTYFVRWQYIVCQSHGHFLPTTLQRASLRHHTISSAHFWLMSECPTPSFTKDQLQDKICTTRGWSSLNVFYLKYAALRKKLCKWVKAWKGSSKEREHQIQSTLRRHFFSRLRWGVL